ncbi:MAG: hypothetical protein KGL39_43070, partial [Patescibacteria group bacterium]|nr:hypothetical protein [Patescibacteria group bacterium]
CPYGVPGDRLYVRETVCILDCRHWPYPDRPRSTVLDATKGNRNGAAYQADCDNDSERCSGELGYKWTRSIHMPRWASRIDLEVTDVRVERLRAITEDDAKAEGFSAKVHKTEGVNTARWQFRETWDTLNGKRQSGALAWQRNPWVWVIEFRKAEAHT